MMKKCILIFLGIGLLCSQTATAAVKYADAVIKKGSFTVVRNGRARLYSDQSAPVEILHQDVVRAGLNSQVVLNTVEETTITIGSNGIFHVKPWEQRKKRGVLRMLYGKMLFKTKKLRGKRRFRLKTATAIMGVKGTEGNAEVGSTGNTVLVSNENICTMQGNLGDEIDIPPNNASMAIGGKTSDIFKVETEKDTDKTDATAPGSANVKLEQQAVNAGVIDSKELEESKETEVALAEQPAFGEKIPVEPPNMTDIDWVEFLEEIVAQSTEKATEESVYKSGFVDVEFEK